METHTMNCPRIDKNKRIERLDRPDGKGPRLGQSFGHVWRHKGHGEHDAHIASEL
ncbi:hypothetical protein NC652_041381 [Populus alba x Populus x berolinensis]|nr:hypothetical protein NC652_041381 [Populus alba x Populus x berolinensis]